MKIYKRLSKWWDDRYGGEWRFHADFMMEEGDTFATAFKQLFKDVPFSLYYDAIPEGKFSKVHVTMSVSSLDDKEFYGDVKAIL